LAARFAAIIELAQYTNADTGPFPGSRISTMTKTDVFSIFRDSIFQFAHKLICAVTRLSSSVGQCFQPGTGTNGTGIVSSRATIDPAPLIHDCFH